MNTKNKSITNIILLANIFLPPGCLVLGGTILVVNHEVVENLSVQLFLLYCVALVAFFTVSYWFMGTRSIPTQVAGDLMKAMRLPYYLYQSKWKTSLFAVASIVLLWLPILLCSYNQWDCAIILVAFIVIWVAFFRALDYAEQQNNIDETEN